MQLLSPSFKRIRKSFGKIGLAIEMPNLIQVQKDSYSRFLQDNVLPEDRSNTGLQGVLNSIFPINDTSGAATLEFVKYRLDIPKYDEDESRQRGVNFSAPLRVTLRLIVWEIDEEAGSREIKGIKEQEVYLGDIPLMTDKGTFVISGTERVIVSQLHRSPGVFFDHDHGKTHSSGKFLYSARVIPYRGSWLDFEFDAKDLLYFRIDRKRKLYISTLLRALGLTTEEMFERFYSISVIEAKKDKWHAPFMPEQFKGIKLQSDLINAETAKVVAERGTKLTPRILRKLEEEGLKKYVIDLEDRKSVV